MSRIIENSSEELEKISSVSTSNGSHTNEAFSSKTAWLMACLSELSYVKFNAFFKNCEQKDYLIKNVEKLISKKRKNAFQKVLEMVAYDHEEEKEKLINELKNLDMKLLQTFDEAGSQAILVSYDNNIVLSFRGTEPTSIKDIKADAKAKITHCDSKEGRIHSGFKEAYKLLEKQIENELRLPEYGDKVLYITGHSLGGALATIAAKRLIHKGGIAACYTFGSPRVGDEKWISNIHVPLYRLVNAADSVTMLPPGTELIGSLSWLFQFIPLIGNSVSKTINSKFDGYIHCGNMRYMTNCIRGEFDDVKLLYSVSFFYRIKGFILSSLPWAKIMGDHSISVYRKKLAVIAQQSITKLKEK